LGWKEKKTGERRSEEIKAKNRRKMLLERQQMAR